MNALERHELRLHGHPVAYHAAGSGPVVLLVHGITSSADAWRQVIPALAERHTVIAPDLMGHGGSAKPRGDYSLGAYASGLRDLMAALGHSMGGGIAMQLAYQFPERVERLALVSSGGLGKEVGLVLRAATLPGAEWVLPVITRRGPRDAIGLASGLLGPDRAEDARRRARNRGRARVAERAERPPCLPPHGALDPRRRRSTGERDRSPLSCRGHADADRLG